MIRWTLVALSLMFSFLCAHGGGGVDVGNGFRVEDYLDLGLYGVESQLVKTAEENLQDLVSVKNQEVAKKIKLGECLPSSLDFERLEPEKIYLLDSKNKFSRSSVRGRLYYSLQGCKNKVTPKK